MSVDTKELHRLADACWGEGLSGVAGERLRSAAHGLRSAADELDELRKQVELQGMSMEAQNRALAREHDAHAETRAKLTEANCLLDSANADRQELTRRLKDAEYAMQHVAGYLAIHNAAPRHVTEYFAKYLVAFARLGGGRE